MAASRHPALPAVLLSGLLAAHGFVFLRKAVEIGLTEPADWGHILAVPPVAAYWFHSLWPRLKDLPARPDWRGFPLLLLGLFGYAAALFPIRNGMLEGACLVLAVAGIVWLALGTAILRLLLPVIVFLLFMIRISDRLWELTTAKLQGIAAAGAAVLLKICTLAADFNVTIDGNVIRLFQNGKVHPLNVAEACSGIRSLMAFLALGFILAFLPQGKLGWQRAALFLLAGPVAVAVNMGRVTALGLLTLVDPKLAQGDFHLLVGILMLVPAAGLLLGCGWILDKLVVDDATAAPTAEPSPTEAQPSPALATPHSPWPAFLLGALPAALCTLLWLASLRLPQWTRMPTSLSLALCGGALVGVVAAAACVLKAQLARRSMRILPLALGTLLAALVGQHLVTRATQAVLVKLPLELRQDLHALPKTLGPWTMEKEEPPESPEIEHALGTTRYITRWYANPAGQKARLHIAYYTGSVDTVPHVPDRCFVAAGATPLATKKVALKTAPAPLSATFFAYEDGAKGLSAVVYFFSANGRFLATPEEVRLQGFNLTDRYGYHCKIEMEFPGLHEEAQVLAAAADFTDAGLPSILNCLPDWESAAIGRQSAKAEVQSTK